MDRLNRSGHCAKLYSASANAPEPLNCVVVIGPVHCSGSDDQAAGTNKSSAAQNRRVFLAPSSHLLFSRKLVQSRRVLMDSRQA